MQHALPGRVFNRRPMVEAAFAFALGLMLGTNLYGSRLLLAVGLLCTFCALCIYYKRISLSLITVFIALGIMRKYISLSIPAPDTSRIYDFLSSIRYALIARTDRLLGANAAVLRGMLWGDRSALSQVDSAAFRDAGIAHVFALSGLHVSFFVGALMLLIPKRFKMARFIITFVFLLCYSAICAFPASLVRASVMALCVLGASITGRRGDLASSLGFAALIILFFSPSELDRAGFLMSFAAVAGIAMLYDGISAALSPLGKTSAGLIAVSLSASIGTFPLIAYFFHRLPLLSLPANLLLLPALPVAVISGFAGVLLDFISPLLSYIPGLISSFIIEVTVHVSRLIGSLPFCTLDIPAFSALACAPFYMALLAVSRYDLLPRRVRWHAFALLMLLCFILAAAL